MPSEARLKTFPRPSSIYLQAQQMWVILVTHVMQRPRGEKIVKVRYGTVAKIMGYDARAGITLHRALGLIGGLCKASGLPTLNSIVVNDITGVPGDHVVLSRDSVREEQEDVMKEDWFAIRAPSSGTFRKLAEGLKSKARRRQAGG